MWMANGLLNSYKSDKSKEKLGSEIFNVLESISFFQKRYYDGGFIMHDLVNDLAKSVSREFCLQVEDDKKLNQISKWTRHIWFSLDCDRILKCTYTSKGLHSLLVEQPRFHSYEFMIRNDVQCDIFSKLKYLRMFSFHGRRYSRRELELADEIGNLNCLRYLDVSWTSIERLPDSICKLYNLETLILEGCSNLTEFPLDFCKLDWLRHINLEETAIKKMPKNIRKLNHLQTLTNFVVGEPSGSGIEELESLNLLQGKLCLSGLNNVSNPAYALEARLQDKKSLEEIHMKFDGEREEIDGSIVENNESVLEALQPNNNLKRLTIENYNGNMFPIWLRGCDLPNLISLKLDNCKGIKFFGNNSANVQFKFLEVLEFAHMSEWEEWLCIEGFPCLKELYIFDCPKLKGALPQHLPSLQKLVISDCPKLVREEFLPFSLHLFINLDSLKLSYCPKLVASREEWGLFHVNSLKWFEISDDFENVESFPEENLLPPSLKSLNLSYCSNLRSMNYKGFLHLKSLSQLCIWNCPSLESLPEEGLPNSLSSLQISGCPLLKEKYKKEGGERWHTISHIPSVRIY